MEEDSKGITEAQIRRFKKARKSIITLSALVFLGNLMTYSPTAGDFSFRTDFWGVFFTGFLFAGAVFFIGYIIASLVIFPLSEFKRPSSRTQFGENRDDSSSSYQRDDWYNDVSNPISPIYQETHRSDYNRF